MTFSKDIQLNLCRCPSDFVYVLWKHMLHSDTMKTEISCCLSKKKQKQKQKQKPSFCLTDQQISGRRHPGAWQQNQQNYLSTSDSK